MNIPNNLTDKSFLALVKPKESYSNTNEMLGDLSHLTNNLHTALHRSNNQVSSEVLGILSNIAGMAITGSRGYLHKK